jgi:hypothetical protein
MKFNNVVQVKKFSKKATTFYLNLPKQWAELIPEGNILLQFDPVKLSITISPTKLERTRKPSGFELRK